MATLSYEDLKKRNNIENFVNRVNSKGSFRKRTEDGEVLVCTGKARIKLKGKYLKSEKLSIENISLFLDTKGSGDSIEIEVKGENTKNFVRSSIFYKDKEFGGVAGKSSGGGSERQELGLINIINNYAKKSNEYYIDSFGKEKKLKNAYKNEGLSMVGKEPYIDVFIETQDNKKYGISMKGESAPSLAGGGIAGIKVIAPDLLDKFYKRLEKHFRESNIIEGSIVDADLLPDIYIKIPKNYIEKILKGNKKMGGPIDYMYVGKMDVKEQINEKRKEIILNGNFYSIEKYIEKISSFYFRVRKRDLQPDNQVKITFKEKNKEGYPLVYKAPKTNKNNFRLVISDSPTRKSTVLLL